MTIADTATLDILRTIAGSGGYLDQPADMTPYLRDWRGVYE